MFMSQPDHTQHEKLKKLYKKVTIFYGEIPPQIEFLGNIDPDYLEDFLKSVRRIAMHPHIDPDFFSFIRLFVAFKEDYDYCKMFNTKLLLSRGYDQALLHEVVKNIDTIPLDDRHKALAHFALKAIYDSRNCTRSDFDALYAQDWTQKDVFDAIEHAGTIFRNGRILTAYAVKD